MNFYVYIYLDGRKPSLCGQAISESGSFRFRYEKSYLKRSDAVPLDPIYFQKTDQVIPYEKITGVIRDAAPDQWGRKLMDSVVGRELFDHEYLLATDKYRVGDIAFGISRDGPSEVRPWNGKGSDFCDLFSVSVEQLVKDFERLEELDSMDAYIRNIISRYASLGGSRPKSNIVIDSKIYIAKFELKNDSFDNPRAEYATMLLAKKCNISIPNLKLINVRDRDILLVERFDQRFEGGGFIRQGVASGVTMTGGDEGSYEDLLTVVKRYAPKDLAVCQSQELYRRMVFNVLVHNIDDHMRNHAFLRKGMNWLLSPAYDVVASTSRSPSHAITIGKQGRLGTVDNALSVCEKFYYSKTDAEKIVDEMQAILKGWNKHFMNCGIAANKIDAYEFAFHSRR